MSFNFEPKSGSSCQIPSDLCPPQPSTPSSGSTWKFQLNMTSFLVVYTLLGALIFQFLELSAEQRRIQGYRFQILSKRQNLLDKFTQNDSQSTLSLALADYEATIDLVLQEGHKLQPYLNTKTPIELKWSNYLNVYYFVLTLLSTIGYGNVAPKTTWGRIFCVGYAMIGIPVLLIFITQVGKTFAQFSISVLRRQFGQSAGKNYFAPENTRNRKMLGTSISVSGVITLVFLYMSLGALIVDTNENWGFINSFYFCFITLTTVGFGDLVPLQGKVSQTPYLILFVRSVYTLFGLAITSMAISLMQKHYAETWAKRASQQETHVVEKLEKMVTLATEIHAKRSRKP